MPSSDCVQRTQNEIKSLNENRSNQVIVPAHRPAVAIRHDAVKLAAVVVEDERQEMAVAFPERQVENPLDVDPFQRRLRGCLCSAGHASRR